MLLRRKRFSFVMSFNFGRDSFSRSSSRFQIALILISCAYAGGRRAKHVSICNSAGLEATFQLAILPLKVFSYYHARFQVDKNAKYGPISDVLLNRKLPIFIDQLLPNIFLPD